MPEKKRLRVYNTM
jgi:hypothetical protein